MNFFTYTLIYSLVMFVGMLLCLKVGHIVGRMHRPRDDDTGNALDGVVFALLGLLLAFSFSESLVSYNAHRDHLTKEANDIMALYSHVDLLPEKYQTALRPLIIQYAEERLSATRTSVGSLEESITMDKGQELQNQIWDLVVAFVKESDNPIISEKIIDAFNDTAGDPAEQLADKRSHMPGIIYILMLILTLMSALMAGYGMAEVAKVPRIRVIVFSIAIVATVYVIIDLEYPRSGLLHSAAENLTLVEAIDDMRKAYGITQGN